MERLLTVNHVAEATGRKLVLSPRDVHMYLSLSIVWKQFPAFDAVETFRILNAPQFDHTPGGWEDELRDRFQSILVSPGELRSNGSDYIVRSSPPEIYPVLESLAPSSGVYVRSRAATEDEDASLHRVANAGLTIAGADSLADNPDYFHASGHATFDETIAMIRRIAPRHVIPINSADPQAFADALAHDSISVHIPTPGQPIDIA